MNRFRRITALVLTLMLALSLCACGEKEKDGLFSEENYQNRSNQVVDDDWADGELTQSEVRGHYDILFQAAGEEAFGYLVDFITLDAKLAMVLRPDRNDAHTLSFDSYDSKTGTARLEQSEEGADGTYTLFCEITFSEQNGKLVFEGTYTVKLDGVVKDDYAISGSMI